MSISDPLRYAIWVEFTDKGQLLRDGYASKTAAIEGANKYWLTRTGLFRAFVRDRHDGDAIVYDRTYDDKHPRGSSRG
jgi:hypothetical protein